MMMVAEVLERGLGERLGAALLKEGQQRVMGFSPSEETAYLATLKGDGALEVVVVGESGQWPRVEVLPLDVVWLETPVDEE